MITLTSLKKGPEKKPPRLILYGPQGIGKTTFAAQAPAPVFIQTEDGIGVLDYPRFPLCQSWEDIIGCLSALATEEHNFKTVVIDTLDQLEKLIFKKVSQDHGKTSIEQIGYAKGYIFALEYWEQLKQALDYLREAKGMFVLLIGHSLIKQYNSPDTDPYDRYRLDLHEKAVMSLFDWADGILFANYKTFLKESDSKTGKGRGIGTGERRLYAEERPAYLAKNRYRLPPELPFDWTAFSDAFKSALTNNSAKEEVSNNGYITKCI